MNSILNKLLNKIKCSMGYHEYSYASASGTAYYFIFIMNKLDLCELHTELFSDFRTFSLNMTEGWRGNYLYQYNNAHNTCKRCSHRFSKKIL